MSLRLSGKALGVSCEIRILRDPERSQISQRAELGLESRSGPGPLASPLESLGDSASSYTNHTLKPFRSSTCTMPLGSHVSPC